MRWSSHTIRQEKLARASVDGSVNPRGVPVTFTPARHRKVTSRDTWVTTEDGKKGTVEGSITKHGDCTLDPIVMPTASLAPDYSVRVGRINPDGTRTMATETTQQVATRRKEEYDLRNTDLANHAENLRRITKGAGILDMPETWGNQTV